MHGKMDENKGWQDMGKGMCADNGLRSHVWKEERQMGRYELHAWRSEAMSIDNKLHLCLKGR